MYVKFIQDKNETDTNHFTIEKENVQILEHDFPKM